VCGSCHVFYDYPRVCVDLQAFCCVRQPDGGGGGNKWHTPLFQFVTLASEQSCVRGHCSSSLFVSSRVHLSEGIANLSASASHETVPLCISARVSIGNGIRPGSFTPPTYRQSSVHQDISCAPPHPGEAAGVPRSDATVRNL